MSSHIYHGPWINWSHGFINGATLTLSDRSGALLTSFIATFVTLVGAQLWRILCYSFHQIRSSKVPEDGLHHQQQAIFRNAMTPGGAAWNFSQQALYWRKKARLSLLRTFPWALFSAAYLVVFALIAVFSSEISKAPGSNRLLVGDVCGGWAIDTSNPAAPAAWSAKTHNDSLTAASYARACYGSNDPLYCGRFPVSHISWTANHNATCPFESGLCRFGNTAAFEMKSELIDSRTHLGINTRDKHRIQYQKVTTCAPLITAGYFDIMNLTSNSDPGLGRPGDTIVTYNYGPDGGFTTLDATYNFTYMYNTHALFDSLGYSLNARQSSTGAVSDWTPVDALNRTNADVSIYFLAANSVTFVGTCDDPLFSAHYLLDDGSNDGNFSYGAMYLPDYDVTVLGCAEQHVLCNPNNNVCSPPIGLSQIVPYIQANNTHLQMSDEQIFVWARTFNSALYSNMFQQVNGRGASALRAQETLIDLTQSPLPSTQWMIEAGSWFDTGLARLQQGAQQWATGPTNLAAGLLLEKPTNLFTESLCYAQLTNDARGTISFSVVGLIVLFAVGGCIILTSLVLETLLGWLQRRFGFGLHARTAWLLDDKLQLQRLFFQQTGRGNWTRSPECSVPVTKTKDKFLGPASLSSSSSTGDTFAHGGDGYGPVNDGSSEESPVEVEMGVGKQPGITTIYEK